MKLSCLWIAAALSLPALSVHAQAAADCSAASSGDPANATYMIEGDTVTLVNGMRSQSAGPDSHTMHSTRLIEGAQACAQLDSQPVKVVLLSDDPGGSGTFTYVAAVPPHGPSFPAVFLGDRIQPKSIVIEHNLIAVTYLDRPANAPMSAAPSVQAVRHFGLQDGHLVDQP